MIAALAGPVHGIADYEHNSDKDNNRGSFHCDLHYCEAQRLSTVNARECAKFDMAARLLEINQGQLSQCH
jgi:hypothetical protein